MSGQARAALAATKTKAAKQHIKDVWVARLSDLSKMLAEYLLLKFNYEIDVVSIYYFSKETLEYS